MSVALLVAACSTESGLSAGSASKATTTTPDATTASPSTTEGGGVSLPSTVEPPTTAPASTSATTPATGTLDWGTCTGDSLTDGLECATLAVPLDYNTPDGATIDLALMRLPAADASQRVGAILTNPGGPGGSGLDFLNGLASRAADIFGSDLTNRFDLVGFDPRGVDQSDGIRCVDDAWLDAHLYLDPTPDTPEETAALAASDTEFNQACETALGGTLVDYSTEATARDMDRIRSAMGDDLLSFYGASYGTYLGGVYATLFPDRVRAMVLDSAYSPVGDDPVEQVKTQLVGFEGAFANWVTWCNGNSSCAFNDGTDAGVRWDGLVVSLDNTPLDVGGRTVNQAVLTTATIESLYSKATWSVLANALAAAVTGRGAGLLALADSYNQRDADGHYSTISQANTVITCASGLEDQAIADPTAAIAEIKAAAPRFAATLTADDFTDSCIDLTGAVQPVALAFAGKSPILVIGGTNDPATPFRWAQKMAGELHATLLTFDGEGHASLTSSKCVSDAAVKVLVELSLPAADKVCAPNAPVEPPVWWTAQPATVDGLTAIEIENGGELIGLPADTYVDFFATDANATTTVDRLKTAYEAAGWSTAGEQDLPLGDDSKQAGFVNKSGDIVVVTVIGAASFTNADVAPLAGLVPAGSGLVLRFPPPG